MANLTVKQYDTTPPVQATLSDTNGPINLTTASSVKIVMKGQVSATVINQSCTITDAANGDVEYVWQTGDTDIADTYVGEFAIHWSDSTVQKVPNTQAANFTIAVDPDVTGSAE